MKAANLSSSVTDHLKWDLHSLFRKAVSEGKIERNPAELLFTPKETRRPVRRVMSIDDVRTFLGCLGQRERLIGMLCILGGLRPGECMALRWPMLGADYVDIQRRIYRGREDTPKTEQSFRKAALADGLIAEIEAWKKLAVDGWVFPSERLTALSKDNVWRRKHAS